MHMSTYMHMFVYTHTIRIYTYLAAAFKAPVITVEAVHAARNVQHKPGACIYIYIYSYTYICIYSYTHTHTHTHTYIYSSISWSRTVTVTVRVRVRVKVRVIVDTIEIMDRICIKRQ
jgi:hypothetical protein